MRQADVPGREFSAVNQPGDAYGSTNAVVAGGLVVVEDGAVDIVLGEEVGPDVLVGALAGSEHAAAIAAAPSAVDRVMN